MNRLTPFLTAAALLFAAGSASAQTGEGTSKSGAGERQMYEDVEIMRRLLQRHLTSFAQACRTCHANPWEEKATAFSPDGKVVTSYEGNTVRLWDTASGKLISTIHGHGGAAQPPLIDGIYLKGEGVVFQAQAPPGIAIIHPAGTQPKEVSEWEQMRKALRGEKVNAPMPVLDTHQFNITDMLVRVLAENGRNFTQLGEKENLTVVVTFRTPEPPAGAAKAPTGTPIWALLNEKKTPTPLPMFGGTETSSKPASTSRDYELLGDLHLKQGKTKEALAALAKAIELNQDASRRAALYRKLTQAYLALETSTSDQQVIAKAIEFLRKATDAKEDRMTPEQPPAPPVRLVVSASKRLLDQVAAGKLSQEEFRRQVSVEWLHFKAKASAQP